MSEASILGRAGEKPEVTVVIGTKARPQLVGRAVDSVLRQSHANLELIVVVDGHDPETEDVLRNVHDRRLRVIVNERNVGCAASRMVGSDVAQGKWIGFLDDDDEWLPERLERQLELIASTDPRDAGQLIVTTLLHIVSPLGDTIRPKRIYDGTMPFDVWLFDRTLIWNGSIFQASSILASAQLVRSLRFRPEATHEDWDFALRAIAERKARVLTVPLPLVRHYRDDGTPRLSNDHKIAESLAWLDGLGDAVSRRGYSAFCLTLIATHAADRRGFAWFWPLLSRAFRKGAPTLRQLLAFLAQWLVGKVGRRRSLRLLIGQKGPSSSLR